MLNRNKITLLMAALHFLSGCQDVGGSSNIRIAGKAPAGQNIAQKQSGENTINYKMWAPYLVNPLNLSPVKKTVLPILDKIAVGVNSELNDWLKLKRWYIGPLTIEKTPQQTLGVPNTEEANQQVAFQNSEAIFINHDTFIKMSEDEQAGLFLHELMMMRYLERFEKMSDLCEKFKKGNKDYQCGPADQKDFDIKKIDEAYASEIKRPLVAKDYTIIREMTAWLLKTGSSATIEKYMEHAIQIGFADRRFDSAGKLADINKQITLQKLEHIINTTNYIKALPNSCHSVHSDQDFKCQYEIRLVDVADSEKDSSTISKKIEIKIKNITDGKELMTQGLIVNDNNLSLVHDKDGYSIVLVSDLVTKADSPSGKEGQLVYLNIDHNLEMIDAIGVIPIVKLDNGEANKTQLQIKVSQLQSNEILERHFVITKEEALLKKALLMNKALLDVIKLKLVQTAK